MNLFFKLRLRIEQYKRGNLNKKSRKEWSKKSPLTKEQIEYLDKKLMGMFYQWDGSTRYLEE